jgi:cobalt-zinc-cadmium efflux system membrane fusion protein
MNRPWRTATLLTAVLLAHAMAVSGCAKQPPEVAEHEAAPRTGSHGGALVTLSPEAVRGAGIAVGRSGAQPTDVTLELPGEIKLNAERSVDVRPTYPGRVTTLLAELGSRVSRGQPLAEILSNESLSGYVVSAPMGGTIVARPASPGAAVDLGSVLYTVSDLSSVWLDVPIYVEQLGRIRSGQRVHVRAAGGPATSASGTISYVGPVLDVDTRTTYARVVLPNPDGRWQPGRLVTAVVVLERVTVPVAVPEDAIVRVGTGAAVFRADSSGFEVQPVTLGRSDGTMTEIVTGLERGARIVTRNAFWLKAELEKEAGGDED